MSILQHPSVYIHHELAEELRKHAAEAELLKQLHPAQLSVIYSQKWFQLFVPESHNGAGLSLPRALQSEEAIAWADGSVGWTVTLCAGAGWFIGFMNNELAQIVFNDVAVCLAGSGKATGTAKKINGGYLVSGNWPYATGAAHATAFTANCIIEENGAVMKNKDGSLLIQSFLFLRNEVTFYRNWNTLGMLATGSNAFAVNEIIVPENRMFEINRNGLQLQDPIYQYPFIPFAELTLAANSSGMAIRFFDLCDGLFNEWNDQHLQAKLAAAIVRLNECRKQFYETAHISWEHCLHKQIFSPELITGIRQCSKQLAATARQLVDMLYPYCGMHAANPETEINRVWRNLHTASQHSLLNRYL
jgi:alkylation response protein AidB-like acyl-CoA dehydrogenase